jgi:hypothetical protein
MIFPDLVGRDLKTLQIIAEAASKLKSFDSATRFFFCRIHTDQLLVHLARARGM